MESVAKKLASSNGSIRDKAFKTLKLWLEGKAEELEEKDYLKLWKALFYCMWMADKGTYQQKLAQRLADIWIVLCGASKQAGRLYVNAFWQTIGREWSGIDRYRLDKFYALLKCFLAASYQIMDLAKWDLACMEEINGTLGTWPLNSDRADFPDALRIYTLENFKDCIPKSAVSLDAAQSAELVSPLLSLAATIARPSVLRAVEQCLASLADLDGTIDLISVGKTAFKAGEASNVPAKNRSMLYAKSRQFGDLEKQPQQE